MWGFDYYGMVDIWRLMNVQTFPTLTKLTKERVLKTQYIPKPHMVLRQPKNRKGYGRKGCR